MKLTFVVVDVTLIGMSNQFQHLDKAFLSRYSLKRVDVKNGGLNKGQVSNSLFDEL